MRMHTEIQFPGLPGITDYINYAETRSGGGLQWCVDGYIPCLKLICSRLWQLDDMVKQYLANLHLNLSLHMAMPFYCKKYITS